MADFNENVRLEGLPRTEFKKTDFRYQNLYIMEQKTNSTTYLGRVDMENGTGWEVMITLLPDGRVAVGIDRRGFFVFKSILSMTNTKPENVAPYLAEKLFLKEEDSILMAYFFQHFFSDGEVSRE